MERERTRDGQQDVDESDSLAEKSLNSVRFSDRKAARDTVMSRHERGESIIQPPSTDVPDLGSAIRNQLRDTE